MTLLGAALVPHSLSLLATEKAEERESISALRRSMELLSEKIGRLQPQTLVFISPHGSCFTDAFAIKKVSRLKGTLPEAKIVFDAACDLELIDALSEAAASLGVATFAVEAGERRFDFSLELDHGVLVPLGFFQKKLSPLIVSVSTCDLGSFDHYRFGVAIQKASENLQRRTVVIASGALSLPETLGRADEKTQRFAAEIADSLDRGEFRELLEMDSTQIEADGGCGIMPLMVLIGAFEGWQAETEILCRENPFGSDYLVARVLPKGRGKKGLVESLGRMESAETEKRRQRESEPVRMARQAVEAFVRFGKAIRPPQDLPDFMNKPAGVFVSLKKGRALRGCIGTTSATKATIAEEIIQNAIHSASRDPRFYPVEADELDHLVYSVDILEEPEEVPDVSHLDHKKYGVYVKCGGRCGLLLPDIEGVESVEQQVAIARQKGGIMDGEPAELLRFRVARYK